MFFYYVTKRIVIILLLIFVSSSFALTNPSDREKQLGIDLYLESNNLVYTPPQWFSPVSLEDASEDPNYRINFVLPYSQDRNENIYLVIPQLGLISPIKQIPKGTEDYKLMKGGFQIKINKYLQGGIIEYVGSTMPGQRGKRIDFGHSNFYKADEGRYKSIFANLMALDPGDQIWYYVKQNDGNYSLFKYRVYASYNTVPNNTEPMSRDGDGADALIFGCIHGLDGRWMVEATYMGEPYGKGEVESDIYYEEIIVEKDPYEDISQFLRNKIDNAIRKISWLSSIKRATFITKIFSGIKIGKRLPLTNKELLIIEYIQGGLSDIYPY